MKVLANQKVTYAQKIRMTPYPNGKKHQFLSSCSGFEYGYPPSLTRGLGLSTPKPSEKKKKAHAQNRCRRDENAKEDVW